MPRPGDRSIESARDLALIDGVLQRIFGRLTPRQAEILYTLIFIGGTHAQIAAQVGCKVGTVRSHFRTIYYILNVHSKVEVVLLVTRELLRDIEPKWREAFEASRHREGDDLAS